MLAALLAVALLTPVAQGSSVQRVELFQECGPGCPEPIDFSGPTGFGWVDFVVAGETLKVAVKLKHATPNSTYTAYYTCGPTHDLACGFFPFPEITTDAAGRGSVTNLPLGCPFGGGSRTDHIDIIGADGSAYVAGDINYSCTPVDD
jgi:hypothetical protein